MLSGVCGTVNASLFFMEAMARIFGESFDEDIERYYKLEEWISYTL